MASIRTNKEFRALLTRKGGATGRELADFTGRKFVYSTWSLRVMETDAKELWTQKDGSETRYMLKNRNVGVKKSASANVNAAASDTAKRKRVRKPANGNTKLDHAASVEGAAG